MLEQLACLIFSNLMKKYVMKIIDLFNEGKELFSVLERYKRKRANNTTTNTNGLHLLELCKNNNLFILNGRIGQDRLLPRATCKDRSAVDYFLSTVENFSVLENFIIHEFSEFYSDAHCPLSICLNVDLLEITRQNHAKNRC